MNQMATDKLESRIMISAGTSRRQVLKSVALVSGTLLSNAADLMAGAAKQLEPAQHAQRKLDLLVLGGTGFIGPHLVRHACKQGHHVTIFTRGRRRAELPADVVRLTGDRNGNLKSLEGKKWDAVVDDSATNPDWVRQSTALLKGNVNRYIFTSSTGVYYPYLKRGLDESAPVHLELDDPKDESAAFGVAKSKCEQQMLSVFGDHGIVVRPTYIVGPGDTTDRFPYWPQRLARGGEVLAPGRRDDPVQFIDVRDLAEFMVHLLENERSGVYNVVGPRVTMTMPRFLEQASAALGSSASFTWVDDYDFLAKHRIEEAIPWAMLKGNDDGMMSIGHARAEAAGLKYRPLATTVRDTLEWWKTVPDARRKSPRFSISTEQESQALAAWHARTGTRN
jgi:nucleoside-diphosphate-sugar epimerase